MRILSVLLAPLVALAVAGSLAACSGGTGATGPGTPATPSAAAAASTAAVVSPPATATAIALVGTRWKVEGTAGTTVAFDGLAVTVTDGGRSSSYAWSAQGDQVLVGARSSSLAGGVAARWLLRAATVERTTTGWALHDASGAVSATLTPDGAVDPTTASTLLAPAAPVDGVVDRPASAIAGRWTVAGDVRTAIAFADGAWRATTSCTTGAVGGTGAYRVLPGGRLLVVRTTTPIRGCPVVDGPVLRQGSAITAIVRAASFRVSGDRLTLFDRAGTELGSLVRG